MSNKDLQIGLVVSRMAFYLYNELATMTIFYCTGTDEFRRDKRKAHHEWLELNRKAQLSSRKRTR